MSRRAGSVNVDQVNAHPGCLGSAPVVQMLESEEAARRLGVKLPTLYAYVSRGLLHAERSPDGRRSLFALDDVERLGQRSRRGGRSETRVATVTTGVCQVRE